jgi:hypothetical protein
VALGYGGFDVTLGETQHLVFGSSVDATAIARYLRELPDEANSGDVYAMFS